MKALWECVNDICRFLAVRDIDILEKTSLQNKYGFSKADVLMVFGNEVLFVAELAAKAMEWGLADYLMICGGVGHSTETLRMNMMSMDGLNRDYKELQKLSEAELYRNIVLEHYCITEDYILIDTKSTNCSENARNGIGILKRKGLPHNNIILMQDPLMQLRSYQSLKRCVNKECKIINYAPFIPSVNKVFDYGIGMPKVWDKKRFFELILGEIPRLRDDQNGYGPHGKNYIGHVEIPGNIEEAYSEIKLHFGQYGNRINSYI